MSLNPGTPTVSEEVSIARYPIVLTIILVVVPWELSTADELAVVPGRAAAASILIGPEAHTVEMEAAADLQWAIRRTTGVELELLTSAPTAATTGGRVKRAKRRTCLI